MNFQSTNWNWKCSITFLFILFITSYFVYCTFLQMKKKTTCDFDKSCTKVIKCSSKPKFKINFVLKQKPEIEIRSRSRNPSRKSRGRIGSFGRVPIPSFRGRNSDRGREGSDAASEAPATRHRRRSRRRSLCQTRGSIVYRLSSSEMFQMNNLLSFSPIGNHKQKRHFDN